MNSITRTFVQAYGGFARVASLAQSPLLLFVRLYWGFQFMQAGWGKLHNLAHVAAYFTLAGNSRARADGVVCRLRGVLRRRAADAGAGVAAGGIGAHRQHAGGLCDSGAAGAAGRVQRSWNILSGASVYVPLCRRAGADFWAGMVCPRHADCAALYAPDGRAGAPACSRRTWTRPIDAEHFPRTANCPAQEKLNCLSARAKV